MLPTDLRQRILQAASAMAAGTAPGQYGTRFWTARAVHETSTQLTVRQGIVQAPSRHVDAGLMVSVAADTPMGTGLGHAATANWSPEGLREAFARAHALACASAGHMAYDPAWAQPQRVQGRYQSTVQEPLQGWPLSEQIALLQAVSAATHVDSRIVDWQASLWAVQTQQLLMDSAGSEVHQHWQLLTPAIQATAHVHGVTQTRSSAGQYNGFCQQGGLEVLARSKFAQDGPRVAHEAIALAQAPACPTGRMDVILMPDQMMLQIHESIGHPLELDRILGDERNFAGTSFVTPDMFGHYQWGSSCLNVSCDPAQPHEFASFAFDDEAQAAQAQRIIEDGVLQRPLGGALSVKRAQALGHSLQGVATTRAASWNRAPIDRMSNLNVEPGDASLHELIASVDHGVLMHTNCSWSIDDSRNKFQFGCEMGQVIRHGQLAEVVRNPNYRGVSATFWRSLARVGNADTWAVMGTPYCGKGEPSQIIRVGHAAPACLFTGIDVFAGAA
jgi:predicted Zn-dependent protease